MKKIAIFISGAGTNMQALLAYFKQKKDIPAQIICVISDTPSAAGIKIASEMGLKTYIVDAHIYNTKHAHEADIQKILDQNGINFICLAGYMRVLSSDFCLKWTKKIINIHPSLLPAFKGLNTHQRAIETKVKFSGCTIHWVSPQVDDGDIIAQAVVPVYNDDTPHTLSGRIQTAEHRLYPKVLEAISLDLPIDHTYSFLYAI